MTWGKRTTILWDVEEVINLDDKSNIEMCDTRNAKENGLTCLFSSDGSTKPTNTDSTARQGPATSSTRTTTFDDSSIPTKYRIILAEHTNETLRHQAKVLTTQLSHRQEMMKELHIACQRQLRQQNPGSSRKTIYEAAEEERFIAPPESDPQEMDDLKRELQIQTPRKALLQEGNGATEQRVTELEAELQYLKQENANLKPLADVGAAVRLRNLEDWKRRLQWTTKKTKVGRSIIQRGNEAAHEGRYLADQALFSHEMWLRLDADLALELVEAFDDVYVESYLHCGEAQKSKHAEQILDRIATLRSMTLGSGDTTYIGLILEAIRDAEQILATRRGGDEDEYEPHSRKQARKDIAAINTMIRDIKSGKNDPRNDIDWNLTDPVDEIVDESQEEISQQAVNAWGSSGW